MPRIVAHFELQSLLGSGTLGELHRARDLDVGRTAALRLLAPAIADHEHHRRDVLQAAERLADVEHPSIVAVYESGHGPDTAFIASEFVPGQRLSEMVRGAPLHPRHTLELAAQLADGLAAAHAHGLTHGALTTASVMVTPKGVAKLLDVGLVRWTSAGHQPPTDDRVGLGAVLFEMLMGRPLEAGWPAELRAPALPPEVQPVLQQLVAPRAGEAFESMATVAAVLRDVARAVARPSTPAVEPVLASAEPGSPGRALLVGLGALLALALGAWALFRWLLA